MFSRFLTANKAFYSARRARTGASGDIPSIVIAVLVSQDTHVSSVTMKFAKAFGEVLNRKLLVVPNIRNSSKHRRLIASFLPDLTTSMFWGLARTLVEKFPSILRAVVGLKGGRQLVDLKVDGVPVGLHLYDSLLLRKQSATIDDVSPRLKLRIVVELACYFSVVRVIEQFNDPVVILPDNTYRQGMVFEYLRSQEIRCL